MLEALRRYADFEGRARRSEYWLFVLFNVLVAAAILLLMSVATAVVGGLGSTGRDGHLSDQAADTAAAVVGVFIVVWILFVLAMFIPGLAVRVRRLHDIGQSGWMLLIALVPLIGGLTLFIMSVLDSQPGPNAYGEDPKRRDGSRAPGQFA
jgi:uncharacterized membrane protein YhaH (DUF805 family)